MSKRFLPIVLSIVLTCSHAHAAGEPYLMRAENPTRLVTTTGFPTPPAADHAVKEGESLRFSYAVNNSDIENSTATYRFAVTASAQGVDKVLWSEDVAMNENLISPWQQRHVPLAEFTGQNVTFKMESRRINGKKETLNPPECLWGAIRVGDFRRKADGRNLIVISLDTLRADRLGAAGGRRNVSPSLDDLIGKSVYFKEAVAQAPWTRPSHVSIFTSRYPSTHRMDSHWRTPGERNRLSASIPCQAEIMRDNGYLTQAFTGGTHMSAAAEFDRGFDEFQEVISKGHVDGRFVFGSAMNWIERNADNRFFLFLHTYEIHAPYRHSGFVKEKMSTREALFARYDSGIRFVDNLVGQLMGELDSLGLSENTMIVVLSDHGELLIDHGDTGHGRSLYDEEILVPLIIYAPWIARPRKIEGFSPQLVDVLPTICDVLSISPPAVVAGQSLKSILSGGPVPAENWAYTEMNFCPQEPGKDGKMARLKKWFSYETLPRAQSVRHWRNSEVWKFITTSHEGRGSWLTRSEKAWVALMSAGGRQLFRSNKKDSSEEINLYPSKKRLAKKLEQRLKDILTPAPDAPVPTEDNRDMDLIAPEISEELRSLGY